MIVTETDYLPAIKAMPPGAILAFSNVSWAEYDELLREVDEQPHYRLTFDRGRLEVMTVSSEHEGPARLIPPLILILAEELNLDYLSRGSTTLRKKSEAVGTDPDDCYYFKQFKKISGKKRIDLSVDPPPDLAIEVDVTSGSLRKFPIYASLGVPEVWRYRSGSQGGKLKFHRLAEGDYDEITHSDLFPFLTPEVVLKFLQKGESEGTVAMAREFRKWVKAHKPKTGRL
jgi:Uma2 family endonuclease